MSLGVISENPTLDSLWASAADDWKDPSEDDNQLLKEMMSENLAGCLEFVKVCSGLVISCKNLAFNALHRIILSERYCIFFCTSQHDYSVIPSTPGGLIRVERKASCDVIGHEAVKSGRCLPPSALLNCSKFFLIYQIFDNDVLTFINIHC